MSLVVRRATVSDSKMVRCRLSCLNVSKGVETWRVWTDVYCTVKVWLLCRRCAGFVLRSWSFFRVRVGYLLVNCVFCCPQRQWSVVGGFPSVDLRVKHVTEWDACCKLQLLRIRMSVLMSSITFFWSVKPKSCEELWLLADSLIGGRGLLVLCARSQHCLDSCVCVCVCGGKGVYTYL